jgi:hypothetical protein
MGCKSSRIVSVFLYIFFFFFFASSRWSCVTWPAYLGFFCGLPSLFSEHIGNESCLVREIYGYL